MLLLIFFGWWGVADGSGKIKPPVVSLLFLVIWFCQFLRRIFGQIGSLKTHPTRQCHPIPLPHFSVAPVRRLVSFETCTWPVTTNKFVFFWSLFPPFFFWGGLENKPIKLHAKAAFARKVLPPGRFPPCAVRCCPGRFYSNRCCWPRYLFFIPRFGDHLACLLVSMMTSRDGSTWKKRYFRRGTLWKLFAAKYPPRLDVFGWHNL